MDATKHEKTYDYGPTRQNSNILASISCSATEFNNYLLLFFLAILTGN